MTALDGSAGRPEALLAATNRFLRCDDVDDLADAVLDAVADLFGPAKAAIVLARPDGSPALHSTRGFSSADLVLAAAAVRDPSALARRVAEGDELWSEDDGDAALLRKIAEYDAVASFSLPIVTSGGIAGTITALFQEEQHFDDGLRAVARSLAAQVGRAVELIEARDRLGRAADHAERERRQAAVLLRVADDLATLTDPAAIPPIFVQAVREASGATFAAVGRTLGDGSGFEFLAGEGLTPDQEALIREPSATAAAFPALADQFSGKSAAGSTIDGPSAIAGLGLDSVAAAPIVVEGQVWGLLVLGADDELALATGWWADLSLGFANIAATAIARAEAVAELARHRDLLASDNEERTLRLTAALEDLQRASDAKTAFLANVSHELRTPLTAILGFVEILATGMDGPLNQAQTDDVATIQASSRHLLELIDDLIDVASIEADRIQLEIDDVPLDELVRETVETMRPLAGQKGISLELSPIEAGLIVRADRGRLREIVLNLLSNAMKFTPSTGRVRVSVAAEPAVEGRPGMIQIDIRDSGIGIAEADHERIFETFVRTAGPSYPGTGLGLAISRELVRLHDGELTVESTVGLGSTFSVHLPPAGPILPGPPTKEADR